MINRNEFDKGIGTRKEGHFPWLEQVVNINSYVTWPEQVIAEKGHI